MSLLTRWAARTGQGQPANTAKPAKRAEASRRAEAQHSQLSQFSQSGLLSSAQAPAQPCPDCGGGSFVRAPGDGWMCQGCARRPAAPSPRTGGVGVLLRGAASTTRPPLPLPPSPPLSEVYLDEVLPSLTVAPLARCSRCYWTAPVNAAGLCGGCVLKLVEAGDLATDRSPPVPTPHVILDGRCRLVPPAGSGRGCRCEDQGIGRLDRCGRWHGPG